jgi:hypothetical protein
VKVQRVEVAQERRPAVEVLRDGERLALLGRERQVGVGL